MKKVIPRAEPRPEPGIDPAMIGSIIFNSVACYGVFDRLGFEKAKEAADACAEHSLRYPLWMRNEKGVFPTFDIPHFGPRSSVFCIAIQTAFLVWVYKGKDLPSGPLMSAALDGYRLYKLEKKED